jgi:hypothetical protein
MGESDERPDRVLNLPDELFVPSDVGDVRADADMTVPGQRRGESARPVLREVERGDARARRGERVRHSRPDPADRAGDEDSLPREPFPE